MAKYHTARGNTDFVRKIMTKWEHINHKRLPFPSEPFPFPSHSHCVEQFTSHSQENFTERMGISHFPFPYTSLLQILSITNALAVSSSKLMVFRGSFIRNLGVKLGVGRCSLLSNLVVCALSRANIPSVNEPINFIKFYTSFYFKPLFSCFDFF